VRWERKLKMNNNDDKPIDPAALAMRKALGISGEWPDKNEMARLKAEKGQRDKKRKEKFATEEKRKFEELKAKVENQLKETAEERKAANEEFLGG
jgi:hypothetical protein